MQQLVLRMWTNIRGECGKAAKDEELVTRGKREADEGGRLLARFHKLT
jgi:hypothetical protein